MITKEDLRWLLDWPVAAKEHILSVYLNVESSGEAALHRRFEAVFKLLTQSLESEGKPDQSEDLKKDIRRVWQFLSNFQPHGQGVAIFADDSKDFIWAKEFRIHVPNQACWLQKPYILPLLEAFDEYEKYGVILADKKRARVFTYCLGEIEEEKAAIAWNDVQHIRTAAKDNMRSAFKLGRTAEMHAEWHLKHVAKLMQELSHRQHFGRLILSGSKETTEELYEHLSQDLQSKVLGRLSLPVETHEKELREALDLLTTQIERQEEVKLVEKFLHTNPVDTKRVIGLDAVIAHLNKGLVHQVIYSENFKPQGGRCQGCGHIFSMGRMMCGRCGSPIDATAHLLEEVVRAVIQKGGAIEEVKGHAANLLDNAGGIGATLRGR